MGIDYTPLYVRLLEQLIVGAGMHTYPLADFVRRHLSHTTANIYRSIGFVEYESAKIL
jgi:hypothetical protein